LIVAGALASGSSFAGTTMARTGPIGLAQSNTMLGGD